MRKYTFAALILIALSSCTISLKSEHPKARPIEVRFAYKNGSNEANTYEGWYKRQTEPRKFAQTKIELSSDQQILLLNKAIVTQFFHMPAASTGGPTSSTEFLEITADSLHNRVAWTGNPAASGGAMSQLPQLLIYIDSVLNSTEAVQQLPAAKS